MKATAKVKMPWVTLRLRELKKTPTGLGRHLGIESSRVFEMLAGRRAVQPAEIVPMAEFMEWPLEKLLQHLPEGARHLPVAPADASTRFERLEQRVERLERLVIGDKTAAADRAPASRPGADAPGGRQTGRRRP